jgi:uncharacterized membrane protein
VADQQQNDDSNQLTDTEIERLKMYQDSFKHMMTFCSGGILLASAVTGTLFPKPVFVTMLVISLGFLAAGAFAAMWGLWFLLGGLDTAVQDGSTGHPGRLNNWFALSLLTAYFGLVLFVSFAAINLAP